MITVVDSRAMTVHLATDHAGYEHKVAIMEWLQAEGMAVVDHGAFQYDAADDFPDYIAPAAVAVASAPATARAIIFGGSGQGEAMAANRVKGVRATVYYGGSDEIVTLSRQHNDANVLSIGARFVSVDEAKRIIWLWLQTPALTDPKYARRNRKLNRIDK